MSPAKTATQRKADERARHRDAGRVPVQVWVRPDYVAEVRALEAKLQRRERRKAGTAGERLAELETTAMTKQPEAREPDQPLALSSSAVLGPNVPERRECDAPICPWCDRQGWDTCGSHYDTYTCEAAR